MLKIKKNWVLGRKKSCFTLLLQYIFTCLVLKDFFVFLIFTLFKISFVKFKKIFLPTSVKFF